MAKWKQILFGWQTPGVAAMASFGRLPACFLISRTRGFNFAAHAVLPVAARPPWRGRAGHFCRARRHRGSLKLIVSLALVAFAMAGLVRPAAAPQVEFANSARISGHKTFFPDPIMGIRGEATVLQLPVRA